MGVTERNLAVIHQVMQHLALIDELLGEFEVAESRESSSGVQVDLAWEATGLALEHIRVLHSIETDDAPLTLECAAGLMEAAEEMLARLPSRG